MKAYLTGWMRALAYFLADVCDMVAEYFEAGPPEPPHGGAA